MPLLPTPSPVDFYNICIQLRGISFSIWHPSGCIPHYVSDLHACKLIHIRFLQILSHRDKPPLASRDAKIAAGATYGRDISRLVLDIAYDRQRLTKLEKVEPQPLQRDRADILRVLLDGQWRKDAGEGCPPEDAFGRE
jgi:hypothetical protein